MAKKLGPPIFLGVFTVLAIIFLTGGGSDDKDVLRQTFTVDAIYYDSGYIEISFVDKSSQSTMVVMEILGMDETFQKTYTDTSFVEIVPFPAVPKYGWSIHPIVLEIDHPEFGHVQLKTEVHMQNDAPPPIIYSRT